MSNGILQQLCEKLALLCLKVEKTNDILTKPPLPCSDFVVTELWSFEGIVPGLRNTEWFDIGPAQAFTTDPSGPERVIDNFDRSANEASLADVKTALTFAVNDTSNTPSIMDYQVREGFIFLTTPLEIEFGTNSEGYIALWLGECGGPLKRVISYAKSVGLFRTPRVTIPAGIHAVRIDNLDWGGTNSNWTPYNVVGGVPVRADRFFDDKVSTTQVVDRCKKVKVCKDTGDLFDLITNEQIKPESCRPCPVPCDKPAPTAEDVAEAMAIADRNVTPRVMNFTNEGGVEALRDQAGNLYPAGTMGTLLSIEDIGTGFVRWSIDGSVPTTQEGSGFTTTGPYHASYNLRNVDLSLVRMDGSSVNSDYSVAFEVYN